VPAPPTPVVPPLADGLGLKVQAPAAQAIAMTIHLGAAATATRELVPIMGNLRVRTTDGMREPFIMNASRRAQKVIGAFCVRMLPDMC
jgi:hypothetical protein